MKDKALFGLFSGVGLVVATLIGVALLMPSTEIAAASVDASLVACAHVRAPADVSYGVHPAAEKCLATH